MILKLERMDLERGLRYTDIRYAWINSEHIETWGDRDGHSEVTLCSGGRILVDIAPDELAAAIDPEGACPEPGQCGYQEYLAYRQEGQTDLSHGAYHTAVRLAEAHGQACTVYESGRVCPSCTKHEQRVRA